jgi:hypothetical protein
MARMKLSHTSIMLIISLVVSSFSVHQLTAMVSGAIGTVHCANLETFTVLQPLVDNAQYTTSLIIELYLRSCPVTIGQADIPYTINNLGLYCLAEDVDVAAGQTGITINSALVNLQLQGHTIRGNGVAAHGIVVNAGQLYVNIENGFISSMVDTCVTVSASTNVVCNNIVARSTPIGFLEVASSECSFINCQAVGGSGSANVIGFQLAQGSNNIISQCIAQNLQSSSVTSVTAVAGYFLAGSETNSRVVQCLAQGINATSADVIPYGILLQNLPPVEVSLAQQISLANLGFDPAGSFHQFNWSPDGTYMGVVADNTGSFPTAFFDTAVLKLNTNTNSLTILPNARATHAPSTFSAAQETVAISWSSDGRYLLTNGYTSANDSNNLRIYSFDPVTEVLTYITGVNTTSNGIADGASWSPINDFVVADCVAGASTATLRLYLFSRIAGTLTELSTIALSSSTTNSSGIGVAWHPSGHYLGVIGSAGFSGITLWCLKVNQITGEMSVLDGCSQIATGIEFGAWSHDGQYFATANQIYQFDPVDETFTLVTSYDNTGGGSMADWSPDDRYVIDTAISLFDPVAGTASFTGVATANGQGTWHPASNFIVGGSTEINLFQFLNTPLTNVIANNIIVGVHRDNFKLDNIPGYGIQTNGLQPIFANVSVESDQNYAAAVPLQYDEGVTSTAFKYNNLSFPPFFETQYPFR